MTSDDLASIAAHLVADDKGLLAIDESIGTCDRRFAALGIPQNAVMPREWRELLVTTPGLGPSISPVILYDETLRHTTRRRHFLTYPPPDPSTPPRSADASGAAPPPRPPHATSRRAPAAE